MSMLQRVFLSYLALPFAQSLPDITSPFVQLDQGHFVGTTDGAVNKFLGIPFGQSTAPPNRFKSPIPADPYTGTYNASQYGPSCPQQDVFSNLGPSPDFPPATLGALAEENKFLIVTGPTSEDCLSLNVFAPANATDGVTLPVIAFLYGGGFAVGGSANYDGTALVKRSLELGQPAIFVSINYRIAAWGFLGSVEINAAGGSNLALRDQRLGLQWIQKHISAFGGDPRKVTLWGWSAGAYCAGFQMLINKGNTEGLFRAVVMESGSAFPPGDAGAAQPTYDALVEDTGCSNSTDSLECLASLDLATLTEGVNKTELDLLTAQSQWVPRIDGDLIPESPYKLILKGEVANVPFIIGDVDDEGTGLALALLNITTDSEFREFLQIRKYPKAPADELLPLETLYPADPAAGSPFGTGTANAITPQYKRLASFETDYAFVAHRRFLMNAQAKKTSAFAYVFKGNKSIPVLGSSHGSDLPFYLNESAIQDYFLHFVHGLDPNSGSALLKWPKYDDSKREILEFLNATTPARTTETFREEAIKKVTELYYKDYAWISP